MSVDIVARGLALQARPVATTATGIGSVSVPAPVQAIQTSGYATAGKGAGHYVNDALATSSLAAAHPRFCKQSADGRYWRLSVENGLNVLCAGAAADDATDDGPAFLAALAYLDYLALLNAATRYGYTKGAARLIIPKGWYYLGTNTLDITQAKIIQGENATFAGGDATVLRWAANTTGIRTQTGLTDGATGDHTYVNDTGADGSIIRNLMLVGGFNSTEGEYHGVHLRVHAVLEHVFIKQFSGDGLYINTNATATPKGYTSGTSLWNCHIQECRNGIHVNGHDANAINFYNQQLKSNRRWNAWIELGINSNWFGGEMHSGGHWVAGSATKCTRYGTWYYVKPDQGAGAATNPPPSAAVTITIASPGVVTWTAHGLSNGTKVRFTTTGALPTGLTAWTDYYVVNAATNTFQVSATYGGTAINTSGSQSGTHGASAQIGNTWWGLFPGSGGAHPDYPEWTTGLTWRDGGAIRADGNGQSGLIAGMYMELDQSPCYLEGSYVVIANDIAFWATDASFNRYGAWLQGGIGGLRIEGNQAVLGDNTVRGTLQVKPDITAPPRDAVAVLDNTNVSSYLYFRKNGVNEAWVLSYANQLWMDAQSAGIQSINNAEIARYDTNGLRVTKSGAKLGYGTGSGGTVTQATSRTTGVTLNKACGQITLVSAAGSASWATFTVTNSVVEAGDVVRVVQKSGADKYMIHVTAVAAGSFDVTFATTGGTTTEQPVFSFTVVKAVSS